MTFKSTAVHPVKGGYEVTGDFTMHGVTKPMTLELVGGRTAEFPKGVTRTGYSAEFVLKRTDFGIDKFLPGVGDKIYVAVSFEGTTEVNRVRTVETGTVEKEFECPTQC